MGALPDQLLEILIHRPDGADPEVLDQHIDHRRTDEGGQRGPEVDVLDPEVEQGQQHGHRLLLIPGDVEDDRQLVDVVEAEDLLELERDHGQAVGVVALPGVQYPRDAADVAERQLVVAVLGTAGGEDVIPRVSPP